MSQRTAPALKLRVYSSPLLLIAGLCIIGGGSYLRPSAVVAAGSPEAHESASIANEVFLPIEVMGADGATRAASIMVTNPTGVDSMYLVGHALGYQNSELIWDGVLQRDGKASYRVNAGPWLPISNAAANVRWPESRYLGIGGGYHTVRVTVPVSGIQAGDNTIEFRFNGTEGVSSGFRILELDLRAGTQSRISGTTFVQNDPDWWTPPSGSDAGRGATLWYSRNVLRESGLAGSPVIVASCSDCHAYSGFDLKYFNFSNESIEARAQFHGLTYQDGRDIAAFIRNVDLDRQDGRNTSAFARPWSPVYQPGPGLTDRGEEDWAAGAGLEWVLDSDDETAYYLFPDAAGNVPNTNPSDDDMARAVKVGSWATADAGNLDAAGVRLDIQNVPISIQYPDWNNWLPDIHPLDAYGYGDFTSTDLWVAHLEMYNRFDTPQEVAENIQRDRVALVCTASCAAVGFEDILRRVDLIATEGPFPGMLDVTYGANPSRYFVSMMSLTQWQAIKTWEVMNHFDLQDTGDETFGGLVTPSPWIFAGTPLRLTGARAGQDPPFFWPGVQSVVFDMAPHMNARCGDACPGAGFPIEGPYGPPGTEVLSGYFTTAWYDLQLILSRDLVGLPNSTGGGAMDWGYTTDAAHYPQTLGVSAWWRMFRGRVVATQSRNNFYTHATTHFGYAFNNGPAFSITNANYWEVVGYTPSQGGHGRNWLAGDIGLTRRALRNYWNEWFSFARTVPIDTWVREPEPSAYLETPDTTPQPHSGGGGQLYFDPFADANNAYRLPALMVAWGMDAQAVDNVARWGEMMWPNGNFEQWFVATDTGEAPGTPGPVALLTVGQATPNPFRTVVTLPYQLSADADVQVHVFDALGRRVATLVDDRQTAGSYAPSFASADLPNGLYLVRVLADGVSASRTMVLAR